MKIEMDWKSWVQPNISSKFISVVGLWYPTFSLGWLGEWKSNAEHPGLYGFRTFRVPVNRFFSFSGRSCSNQGGSGVNGLSSCSSNPLKQPWNLIYLKGTISQHFSPLCSVLLITTMKLNVCEEISKILKSRC